MPETTPNKIIEGLREAVDVVLGKAEPANVRRYPLQTCPQCGEKAAAFICDRKVCPMNGGAAYG